MGASGVHVVFLDDLRINPKASYERILDFLDLEYDGRADFPIVNQSRTYRSLFINKIKTYLSDRVGLHRETRDELLRLARPIFQLNIADNRQRVISEEFRLFLQEYLERDILKLQRITKTNLSHWLQK